MDHTEVWITIFFNIFPLLSCLQFILFLYVSLWLPFKNICHISLVYSVTILSCILANIYLALCLEIEKRRFRRCVHCSHWAALCQAVNVQQLNCFLKMSEIKVVRKQGKALYMVPINILKEGLHSSGFSSFTACGELHKNASFKSKLWKFWIIRYGIAPHDFCEAPQVILIQCFCHLGTAAK